MSFAGRKLETPEHYDVLPKRQTLTPGTSEWGPCGTEPMGNPWSTYRMSRKLHSWYFKSLRCGWLFYTYTHTHKIMEKQQLIWTSGSWCALSYTSLPPPPTWHEMLKNLIFQRLHLWCQQQPRESDPFPIKIQSILKLTRFEFCEIPVSTDFQSCNIQSKS